MLRIDGHVMTDAVSDPLRLATLADTRLLDSASEAAFDRLVWAARELLGVPVSMVSLVDDHRQFFKAEIGLCEPWHSRRGSPLSHAFCKDVVADRQPVVVGDSRAEPRYAGHPGVEELGITAYLGVPVNAPNGQTLGAFCVVDQKPRSWTERDVAIVRCLACNAEAEIALRLEMAERRRAEEALIARQADLDRLLAKLQRFAAAASHDLMAPLRRIRLFADLLEGDLAPAAGGEVAHMVGRIRDQADFARDLVDAFLRYARNGAAPVTLARVRLAPAIEEARKAAEAEDPGIRLAVTVASDLPDVMAEPTLLVQVFANLFANAVKYRRGDQAAVTVDAVENDGDLVVRVADDGVGVDPGDADRIFEPFLRFNRQNGVRGFGLGLSICRDIMDTFGGRIWLAHTAPTGSRFCLAFQRL